MEKNIIKIPSVIEPGEAVRVVESIPEGLTTFTLLPHPSRHDILCVTVDTINRELPEPDVGRSGSLMIDQRTGHTLAFDGLAAVTDAVLVNKLEMVRDRLETEPATERSEIVSRAIRGLSNLYIVS